MSTRKHCIAEAARIEAPAKAELCWNPRDGGLKARLGTPRNGSPGTPELVRDNGEFVAQFFLLREAAEVADICNTRPALLAEVARLRAALELCANAVI